MQNPESLPHLLHHPALAGIHTTLALHRRVLKAVRAVLPPLLARHCQDCVVKPERLILYMDSPLYTTQLRFHVRRLQQRLDGDEGLYFRDIQVRNLMPLTARAVAKPKTVVPSPAVAALLQGSAAGDDSDALAHALRKLAGTIARKNGSA